MPPKKSTQGKTSGSELQKHLDNVKRDLKELTTKIGKANRAELSKLSYEASKTVGDTASDIIKSSSVLLDKAFKVLNGALEGGKKAIEKENKIAAKKSAQKIPAAAKRKSTTTRKTASPSAAKKKTAAPKKSTARTTARKKSTTRKTTTKK